MDYVFSRHSLEQIELRNISKKQVKEILINPDEVLDFNGKRVYQSVVISQGRKYLIRIFVNSFLPNAFICNEST